MHNLKKALTLATLFVTSCAAFAEGDARDSSPSVIKEAILNFLPVAFILLILYIYFRRQTASVTSLRQQSIERHTQHMQRVEELLERLVTAVERSNKP